MGRVITYALAIMAGLFLTSCSTISTVATWRSPTAPDHRYGKIMVASLARNAETRRLYEDVVTGEFYRHGINAVPSYRVIGGKGVPSRQALLETGRKIGVDALLTIQTTQVERHTDIDPGYISNFPDYYYPRFGPDWGGYGYGGYGGYGSYGGYYGGYGGYGGYPWGGATWYQPPTMTTYDVATIQTNLFAEADGKMVWAATMETLEPGRVVKVAKDLAETLSKSLGKEGLI